MTANPRDNKLLDDESVHIMPFPGGGSFEGPNKVTDLFRIATEKYEREKAEAERDKQPPDSTSAQLI